MTNTSNNVDKAHKSNVEQKKTDTKEVLQFDSICMMLKQAKLSHSIRNQDSGSSWWGLRRGQETGSLGYRQCSIIQTCFQFIKMHCMVEPCLVRFSIYLQPFNKSSFTFFVCLFSSAPAFPFSSTISIILRPQIPPQIKGDKM